MQFDRIAEVRFGQPGEQGPKITDNRIVFRVLKTEDATANELDVDIYNLNKASQAEATRAGAVISLAAGYAKSVSSILGIGDITRASTDYPAPDVITRIVAGDGLRALRDTRVTLAYRGGVTADRLINSIAEQMGIGVRQTDADMTGSYRQGFAFLGTAREALDSVTSRFGLDWSIQNFDLQILERRTTSSRQPVVITPDTGMLGSPEPIDDLGTNLLDDKARPGYRVRCLLNPRIEPGIRVVVASRDVPESTFRAITVEHSGDTRGLDWHSVVEVAEVSEREPA